MYKIDIFQGKFNSISLCTRCDKMRRKEVSNLKNEVFNFVKEREDYENRFMGDRKGYLGYMKLGMCIIYQSGDAK